MRGRGGLSAAQHTDPHGAHEYCRGPTAELKQEPLDPPDTHQLTPCSSAGVTVTPGVTHIHTHAHTYTHTTPVSAGNEYT